MPVENFDMVAFATRICMGSPTAAPSMATDTQGAASSFDDVELGQQETLALALVEQLRDVDSAQSENEMWTIASDNAGIRRELLRLGGRRVEE